MTIAEYTLAEISKHISADSCWLVIHGQVYDVTEFLSSHPGGAQTLLDYAGKDATPAYDEVHHPSLLAKHLTPLGAAPATSTASSNPSTKHPSVEKPDLYTCQSTHDFELVASKSCSPKAWAFFSSAATDCITHTHLNRAIFDRVILRPRVLIDVRDCDITTTILGIPTTAPFFVAPTAMQKMIHPNGEVEMARGAKASGLIHAVSTSSSYPLKEIVAPGGNQVLQLYVNKDRSHTTALLKEAKQLGFRAVLVTVDAPVMGKREADERVVADTPVKSEVTQQSLSKDKRGSGMGRLMGAFVDAGLVWSDLAWIKEQSGGLPIVVKGVQNAADAKKAVELGVEGVYLSNHGGRSLDTSPPALLTLLEIHKACPEILGKVEIIVDGGVRRGTDIFKALCLGATAVAVGRPYIYSLNYGAEGVEWLTEIFKDELQTTMRICGITSLKECHPGFINTGDIDTLVPGGVNHPWIKWRAKL